MPIDAKDVRRVRTLKANGLRVKHIVQRTGLTHGDVKKILKTKDCSSQDDNYKGARQLVRAGFPIDVVLANFGDVISRKRLEAWQEEL